MLIKSLPPHAILIYVIVVEASAVLEGLILAKSLDFQNVVIKTDYEQVFLSATNHSKCASWKIYPLIKEIRSLQGLFCKCSWKLVKRGANAAADWLARQAKMRMDLGDWLVFPPSSLVRVLKNDGLPTPSSSSFLFPVFWFYCWALFVVSSLPCAV